MLRKKSYNYIDHFNGQSLELCFKHYISFKPRVIAEQASYYAVLKAEAEQRKT